MAKSKEVLLAKLYASRKHCTLEFLGKVLEAYGLQKRPRKVGKPHVVLWRWEAQIVSIHRPHGQFVDVGAVDDAIEAIERAEEIRKGSNGKPKDTI